MKGGAVVEVLISIARLFLSFVAFGLSALVITGAIFWVFPPRGGKK